MSREAGREGGSGFSPPERSEKGMLGFSGIPFVPKDPERVGGSGLGGIPSGGELVGMLGFGGGEVGGPSDCPNEEGIDGFGGGPDMLTRSAKGNEAGMSLP